MFALSALNVLEMLKDDWSFCVPYAGLLSRIRDTELLRVKRGVLGLAPDILKILEPEQKQKPRAGPESLDDTIPTRKNLGHEK